MTVKHTWIKHLDVLSVAKVGAVIGAIWGAIYGFILGIVVAVGGATAASGFGMTGLPLAGLGVAAVIVGLIVGAIVGAIFGFIFGAIATFFYNVAFGMTGGIEVDLEIPET